MVNGVAGLVKLISFLIAAHRLTNK